MNLMRSRFFIFLYIISFASASYGFSSRPCSEGQKSAYESLSSVPAMMVTYDVAAVAASQVLWVASTSHEKGIAGSETRDSDTTIYWLLPSLSFELVALLAYPACGAIAENDDRVLIEETEHRIKTNTRIASGISLAGQFFSLTNTLDEEKRQITRTLMATTLVSQFVFEWLWHYRGPQTSAVMIGPFLKQDARGLQLVYRF